MSAVRMSLHTNIHVQFIHVMYCTVHMYSEHESVDLCMHIIQYSQFTVGDYVFLCLHVTQSASLFIWADM